MNVNVEKVDVSPAAIVNNQVLALMLEGDYDSAYRMCREGLRRDPDYRALRANLATVLKMLNREAEAIPIYEDLIRKDPTHGIAINNLAYSYLRNGNYRGGWLMYHQRLRSNAQNTFLPLNPITGLPVYCNPAPKMDDLYGKHIILVPEQGIGDELLFLRFVPILAKRAMPKSIWYAPSVKLHCLARRCTDLTDVCNLTDMRFSGVPKADAVTCMLADLPLALEHDGSYFPPSLRLPGVEPMTFDEPTLGVTWRAGTVDGTHRGHIFKNVTSGELGRALRDVPYKIRVIQRGAEEKETLDFAAGLGRPFDTYETPRGASSELLKLVSLLAGLSGYVGVSNTNTHLRGMLGLDQHVMLGLPGEWRWPVTHQTSSPWFPQMTVYRKEMRDQWAPALERLTAALIG